MNSFDINERENESQRAIERCGESKSSMIRSTDKSKLHIIVLETELIYIELKMVLSRLYQFWPTVETRQLPSLVCLNNKCFDFKLIIHILILIVLNLDQLDLGTSGFYKMPFSTN